MSLCRSCPSLKAAALLLVGACGAPALAGEASSTISVGATVVGSVETLDATNEAGEPVLVVSSSTEPVFTADEGVELRNEDGFWTATAAREGGEPLYVTLTY